MEDDQIEYTTIKVEPAKVTPSNGEIQQKAKKSTQKLPKIEKSPTTSFTTIEKMEREPSFASTPRSADKDRERIREMSDIYYMPRQPPKDSFDLFFESAAASVKSLPPKLAAELKSRVSQILSEFELRAICEKEAQEKAASSVAQSVALSTTPVAVAIDQPICSSSSGEPTRIVNQQVEGQTIAHYVYSYQSK